MTRWLLVLTSLIVLLLGGCLPSTQTARQCDPEHEAKLAGKQEIPPEWSVSRSEKDHLYDSGSIDQCSVYFTAPNAGAFQEVYEYLSDDDAARGYLNLREVAFDASDSQNSMWTVPSELSIEEIHADEHFIACSQVGDRLGCQFLARYGQLVALFFSHIDDETMTLEDFGLLVASIDQRMVK